MFNFMKFIEAILVFIATQKYFTQGTLTIWTGFNTSLNKPHNGLFFPHTPPSVLLGSLISLPLTQNSFLPARVVTEMAVQFLAYETGLQDFGQHTFENEGLLLLYSQAYYMQSWHLSEYDQECRRTIYATISLISY